jgi:hypothetical protein
MLSAVGKFFDLSSSDRRLVLQTTIPIFGIRLALWCLPFQTICRVLRPLARAAQPSTGGLPSVDRLAWAVQAASRCIPAATCLTQALALHLLLGRHGYSGRVLIGVAKDPAGIRSHAWLEFQGKVLIGGSNEGFTPTLSFE